MRAPQRLSTGFVGDPLVSVRDHETFGSAVDGYHRLGRPGRKRLMHHARPPGSVPGKLGPDAAAVRRVQDRGEMQLTLPARWMTLPGIGEIRLLIGEHELRRQSGSVELDLV